MKHKRLLLALAFGAASVSACNTFIGADDPDVIEEGELQPGQENDDVDSSDTGEQPATCGDGVVNYDEECDDGNTDANDGCDACEVVCGEDNLEGGADNELESADHHCYQFVQAGALDHEGANDACHSWHQRAHLVTIESVDEFVDVQNGVTHFAGGGATTWLGAKRRESGSFEWMIDGDPAGTIAPTDKHWTEGEPREPEEEEELCLTMNGQTLGYAAASCGDAYFYICELDRPGVVPPPPEDGGP